MKAEDYGEITAVANSIRKYFGLHTYHSTDQMTDEWLREGHFRCVTALLIDAMGTSVLEKHLSSDSFLRSHMKRSISTVFPPTTTAATTSFRTGRNPVENGWLGWNQYMKESDDNRILFLNQSQYEDIRYTDDSNEILPVPYIVDEMNEKGMKADSVWPSWGKSHPSESFQQILTNTLELVSDQKMQFVYSYWDAFDSWMHRNGPSAESTGDMMKEINAEVEKFAKLLPDDVGLMIIADHSQIDVRQKVMTYDAALRECFRHEPGLEPRTIAFYIKDEKRQEFEDLFNRNYSDYRLYTHDEVIQQNLFGTGEAHPRFEEFIGDYLAISETDLQIIYRREPGTKGDHAGGLKEEAMIPLILYAGKEKC